jgi:hypothetical protein
MVTPERRLIVTPPEQGYIVITSVPPAYRSLFEAMKRAQAAQPGAILSDLARAHLGATAKRATTLPFRCERTYR